MNFLPPLFGGMLIGLAALLMLLFNGKIMGVSGIVGGIFSLPKKDTAWRFAFLAGIFLGGTVMFYFSPEAFLNSTLRSTPILFFAGIFVGIGTRMGGGCTSGHGVCGISRFSIRSIVATLLFMFAGSVVVFLINHIYHGVV